MSKKTKKAGGADVKCAHCGAHNPHSFTFCFACKIPRGTKRAKATKAKKSRAKKAA